MTSKTLLKDTFSFKTTPFLVKVEEKKMFVHGKTGEVRGINAKGAPTGMDRTSRKWKICKCRVASLRPDYPYTVDKEWSENVDKHFREIELLEIPKKKEGILRFGYTISSREAERDAQELAEDVINKMKQAYEQRDKVQTPE